MRKTLSTIILGLSLLGFSCAEKIIGPEKSAEIPIKSKSYWNSFDTKDVVFDDAIKSRLSEVESKYSGFKITPRTQKFNGQEYVLGFSIEGKYKTEPPNRINLSSDFNYVAGDFNYKELPRGNIIDGVDVPETPEVLRRLEETNKSWTDIGFGLIYLENKSGKIILSDKGEKMINGILIYPKVSQNAGNSFMDDAARYIMTGEGTSKGGMITIKIDSLKIKLDTLKFH